MIQIEAMTFAHARSSPIFQDFSWQAGKGEAWAVLGPSGCGKTTLLYLLAGLRFPGSGQVRIEGELLKRPRPHTGLILQDFGLLPWATVRQNASLGLRVREFYGPDEKHAPKEMPPAGSVEGWLKRLSVDEISDKYPAQISGGQRQRIAIARTLALQPDLLLMDEPFASLDAPTRQGLQSLTLELQSEQELTLVIVTHSIEEAAILGRKILLLSRPPNTQANVIENPQAGQEGYRDSTAYLDLCRELRARMENP
jgi:ABC-type nitrate/sulfonate/bicarbonate transport system ATPase subunit